MKPNMFSPLADDEIVTRGTPSVDAWVVVSPAPEGASQPANDTVKTYCPTGYNHTAEWRYLNAEGQLLAIIVRYDPVDVTDGRKEFRPFTYFVGPDGGGEWRSKSHPAPRPLYGLDRLASRPSEPVLVVEGEKAADAACELFPQHVVVTSPGGANGADKADWEPLKGRTVVIWPDADEPGKRYAKAVVANIQAIAQSVSCVDVPAELPEGWDLADNFPASLCNVKLADLLERAPPVAGWGKVIPIISTLPPVKLFIAEMLPSSLGDYILDIARRQQAPADFAAVAAVCGIAATVGNRIRIAPKQNDDWVVVPNLWGAIIGRPSAMKSPALKAGLCMVFKLEGEMKDRWIENGKSAGIDDALAGFEVKGAKRRAEKALNGGDRNEARSILSEFANAEDKDPTCPRIVVNDASVEKLGELLNENPRGVLLVRDELPGLLARLNSEEHQSERAFYLESYNGDGQFTYDRIGRGTIRIENCTLSLIGGVQPSRIAPIVRGAIGGTSNDGLIQRLQLAVWPDDVSAWSWIDDLPDLTAKEKFEKVFRALHELNLGTSADPVVLRFTPAAQAMFREWMTEIQVQARSGKLAPTMESHLLKMPKTVASLALLFELIDGGRIEVGEKATLLALAWADYLRSHAERLYACGDTIAETSARLIVERRSKLPHQFTARDIHQKDWVGLADRGAVSMAIELLVATNHCREIPRPVASAGGRPTAVFVWNPTVGRGVRDGALV